MHVITWHHRDAACAEYEEASRDVVTKALSVAATFTRVLEWSAAIIAEIDAYAGVLRATAAARCCWRAFRTTFTSR